MKIIRTDSAEFEVHFRRIRERGRVFDPELWAAVGRIVEEVGRRGDEALFEYTARWDGHAVSAATVEASAAERTAAVAQVAPGGSGDSPPGCRENRTRFTSGSAAKGGLIADEEGVELGQRILPLERVGIYAPGGLACYPSTVLMTAIPARIAGVGEICPGDAFPRRSAPSADRRCRGIGRCEPDLQDRRRPGDRGPGLRHGVHPPCGQDRRSGERLCGGRQEDGLRPGRRST